MKDENKSQMCLNLQNEEERFTDGCLWKNPKITKHNCEYGKNPNYDKLLYVRKVQKNIIHHRGRLSIQLTKEIFQILYRNVHEIS